MTAARSRRSFLRTSAAIAGSAALAGRKAAAQGRASAPLVAYVGTFSSPLRDVLKTQVDLPPGNGRGIHVFHVDRATGALTPAGVHESGTSPSCLAANAAGDRLYSANETDRVGAEKEGTVSAYAIDRATGALSLLGSVRSGGAGPTYVSLHPTGRFLFVANYFGGSVAVLPVRPDGSVGEPVDVKKDEGPIGPTKAASAPPGSFAVSGHDRTHAHMIQADPGGRFVLHVDLALDRIGVWRFDATTGALSPADPAFVPLPPGDGPRHFAFHPDGRRLYSIQEEARRSSRSTTTAARDGSRPGRRSRRCRRGSPAATSRRRCSSRPTAGSSTRATACTTASRSSRSARRGRSRTWARSGPAATTRAASPSTRRAPSSTAATSERTP